MNINPVNRVKGLAVYRLDNRNRTKQRKYWCMETIGCRGMMLCVQADLTGVIGCDFAVMGMPEKQGLRRQQDACQQ